MSYICKECQAEVVTDERTHSTELCHSCRRALCRDLGEHLWAPTLTGKTWCTRCDIDFHRDIHGTHGEYMNKRLQAYKQQED